MNTASNAHDDSGTLLAVSNLTKRFGGLIALNDVSFSTITHRVTSIVGPNGAGKTTLFNLISGVIRPDEGKVVFNGADVSGWQPHRLASAGLARVRYAVSASAAYRPSGSTRSLPPLPSTRTVADAKSTSSTSRLTASVTRAPMP